MSSFPSPLKSAMARAFRWGLSAATLVISLAVPNVPLPLLSSTLMVPSAFEVMMSGLPSPFTSARNTSIDWADAPVE